MKNIILFLGCLFFALSAAFAQEIVFDGRVTDYDNQDNLQDVKVFALKNGTSVFSTTTSRNGNYAVKINAGDFYTIKYEKNGYVSKIMFVDLTGLNAEDIPIGGKMMPPVDIKLFTDREGVDFSFLDEEPVVEWAYDQDEFIMDWDRQTYNRTKKKIQDKLAEAERLGEEQDAEYNALINEGDKLFRDQDYSSALSKYEEAISIEGKQMEEHPNNRILEISDLLQKQAEEQLADQQENEEYYAAIEEADRLAESKDYKAAISKYEEAIQLNAEEQYPKDQVADLKIELEKIEDQAEYDQLIKRADGFFKQNSLRAAKDMYEDALDIFPNEAYPKEQLAKISGELDAQKEIREKKEKYEAAIAKADELYNQENYSEAIQNYEEAIGYESAATYPSERIKLAKQAIEEKLEAEGVKVRFDSLVKVADQAVEKEEFETAIASYDEALDLFDDEAIKEKKSNAVELLEAKEAEAQTKEQIAQLLASADEKVQAENYSEALEDFNAVLALDENNSDALAGKQTAEEKMNEMAAAAQKKAQFDSLVEKADKAVENENWSAAKTDYNAALKLFEQDDYVKSQLAEVEGEIAENKELAEMNAQIDQLIKEAEASEKENDWETALAKYQEILDLDSERIDVQEMLVAAQKSQAEWQENQAKQEQFAQLKNEAEALFEAEKWSEAKEKYKQALALEASDQIEEKIETINGKIAELESEQEQKERFNNLVSSAESLENEDKLEEALAAYKEALDIDDSEAVSKKITALEKDLLAKKVQQEEDKKYAEAIEKGKKAFDEGDYSSAVKSFEDALELKPNDENAKELKANAAKEIAALESIEEQYNSIIDRAENALKEDNLNNAKELFEEAQDLQPQAALPQQKIVEIDELLRKKQEQLANAEEQANINENYQSKLDEAQQLAKNSSYEEAIKKLKEAQQIKPSEEYPKEKIADYEKEIAAMKAEANAEEKYAELIESADQKFKNEAYKESIKIYKEAFAINDEDPYLQNQIVKAEEAIERLAKQEKLAAYNELKKAGDQAFQNEDYEKALDLYKKALNEKPGDQYAADQLAELKQILDNLEEKAQLAQELKKEYNKLIDDADERFESGEYNTAQELYNKALKKLPNDDYAERRMKESSEKAQEMADNQKEEAYNAIVAAGDEFFNQENYKDAKTTYRKALAQKPDDQSVKDKLSKINNLEAQAMREESELEYLGEKQDISIMEGMALLEQGEAQRKNKKLTGVEQQKDKSETQASLRALKDYSDRVILENEILRVYDKRVQYIDQQGDDRDQLLVDLTDQQDQLKRMASEESNFARAEMLRSNENLTYISDEYSDRKRVKSIRQQGIVEDVAILEDAKLKLDQLENNAERTAVMNTNQQLEEAADKQKDNILSFAVMAEQYANEVESIEEESQRAAREDKVKDYANSQRIAEQALLSELKKSESEKEKQVIQQQIEKDIDELVGAIQDRRVSEADELYAEQIASEVMLTEAAEQYQKTTITKDDARLQATEQLKDVTDESVKLQKEKAAKELMNTQKTIGETEALQKRNKLELSKFAKDKSELELKVEEQQDRYVEGVKMKEANERTRIDKTSENIEEIEEKIEVSNKVKNTEKVVETRSDLQAIEDDISSAERERKKSIGDDQLKTQEVLDEMKQMRTQLESNTKNSLGEEFPEGVTQEVYVRKDKDGIPYKVITRRIVVENGYGKVYIRTQTRNGVTFSTNNRPITEEAWIRATENADLVQHF
jgi:tetratricopeptide (TPR) repeat protein